MKNILLLVALFSSYSFGQMNTDRPSFSMSSQTIRKGEFQIEAGLQLNNRGQDNPAGSYLQAPTAQFRIGLSDFLELRIQNGLNIRQGFSNKLSASMENIELGLKYNIVHAVKTNMSIVAQGIAPTSSGNWQPREKGVRLVFALDHKIKKSGSLGYNLGSKFSAVGNNNDFKLDAYYSVFYAHQMNSKLGLFAEVQQVFPDLDKFDEDAMELNADCGLTYALSNNLQVDYVFGFGLLNRMNFQSVGLSYRIQPAPPKRAY
ncbi:transporter [bacterium]|nr:transporter [bacterium]